MTNNVMIIFESSSQMTITHRKQHRHIQVPTITNTPKNKKKKHENKHNTKYKHRINPSKTDNKDNSCSHKR